MKTTIKDVLKQFNTTLDDVKEVINSTRVKDCVKSLLLKRSFPEYATNREKTAACIRLGREN